MGAFEGAKICFNKPLDEIAKSLNYSESNILILQGNEKELRKTYPNVYNNLLLCEHNRDNRTPFEYGQDIVASWILEDIFLKALDKSQKFKVKLNGADKRREILPNKKVSSESDCILLLPDGKTRKLEFMCDYTEFWRKKGKLHLRDCDILPHLQR